MKILTSFQQFSPNRAFYGFFILFSLVVLPAVATNYTWTGSSSKNWSTSGNWSPAGVPGSGDNVTIGSGSDTVQISGDITIANLTMSGRKLNLAGYTLTSTGTSALSGGKVYNGKLLFSGSQVTFSSTADIASKVKITSPKPYFNGGTFADSVVVNSVLASSSALSSGGTTFNGPLVVSVSGTTYTFRMEGSSRNIYNAPVSFTVGGRIVFQFSNTSGTNTVFSDTLKLFAKDTAYIQQNGASGTSTTFSKRVIVTCQDTAQIIFGVVSGQTTTFNDDLDISSSSKRRVYIAHSGSVVFNDNVFLSCISGAGIYFGYNTTASLTHSSGALQVGTGGFSGGRLDLYRYSKTSSDSTALTFTGTSKMIFGINNSFTGPVRVVSPMMYLNGTTFNSYARLDQNGTTNTSSTGGNTFNGETVIGEYGTGQFQLCTSASATDNFNGKTILKNYASYDFSDAGNLVISKDGTSNFSGSKTEIFLNTASRIILGYNEGSVVNMNTNLELNSISDGWVYLGGRASKFNLGAGKTIKVGSSGFSGGRACFYNVEQVDTTSINLTFTGSGSRLSFIKQSYSPFGTTKLKGKLNYSGPVIDMEEGDFFGDVTVSITGGANTNSYSNGGNNFYGNLSFENNSGYTARLAYLKADVYHKNVFLNKVGSGNIQAAYIGENIFKGNISTNGGVLFGTNGGWVKLDSSATQTIDFLAGGSGVPSFKKLKIQKTGGQVKVNLNGIVTDSLSLVNGIIKMGNSNYLDLKARLICSGASNVSYVDGQVRKTGNTAFSFPIGSENKYFPLSISAPSNSTDAFTAKYFSSSANTSYSFASKDGTLNNLDEKGYWTLDRNVGTSTPNVTLNFGSNYCGTGTPSSLKVANWNGSTWKDRGNSSTTSTSITVNTQSGFGPFLVSNLINSATANAGSDVSVCSGSSVSLSGSGTGIGSLSYSWDPSTGLSSTTVSNPSANPTATTTYYLKVTDSYGCTGTDGVVVTVNALPTASAGRDTTIYAGDTVQIGSTAVSGITYAWSPTNDLSSSNNSNPLTYSLDTVTYTLTVSNSLTGCLAKDSIKINVLPFGYSYLNAIKVDALNYCLNQIEVGNFKPIWFEVEVDSSIFEIEVSKSTIDTNLLLKQIKVYSYDSISSPLILSDLNTNYSDTILNLNFSKSGNTEQYLVAIDFEGQGFVKNICFKEESGYEEVPCPNPVLCNFVTNGNFSIHDTHLNSNTQSSNLYIKLYGPNTAPCDGPFGYDNVADCNGESPIACWFVLHGTPDFAGMGGNAFARIIGRGQPNIYSEGIFTKLTSNCLPNHSYILNFDYSNTNNAYGQNFYAELGYNTSSGYGGENGWGTLSDISNSNYRVNTFQASNYNTCYMGVGSSNVCWQSKSTIVCLPNVLPNNSNGITHPPFYNSLMFYTNGGASAPGSDFYIDNVVLKEFKVDLGPDLVLGTCEIDEDIQIGADADCNISNVTYEWILPDQTVLTDLTTGILNLTSPYQLGNYKLSATYTDDFGNSCTVSDVINISVKEALGTNAYALDFVCKGTQAGYIQNGSLGVVVSGGQSPYSYSWVPVSSGTSSGWLSCSNCQYPSLSAYNGSTNSDTYQVTVTDANGCTSVDQVTVRYIPCCSISGVPDVASYTFSGASSFGSPSTISSSYNSGTNTYTIQNETFTINGYFHVGANLILDECHLLMGPMASIIVDPGYTLTLTGNTRPTHLEAGCNYMWRGIGIGGNAHLVSNNNTLIEHALVAVNNYGQSTNTFDIDHTIFNKNMISVFVGNSSASHNPGSVTNSQFLSTNANLGNSTAHNVPTNMASGFSSYSSPYSTANYSGLIDPLLGQLPTCGIWVSGQQYSGFTIGSYNLFENLYIGINSLTSECLVKDNVIQNMGVANSVGYPYPGPLQIGSGIGVRGSSNVNLSRLLEVDNSRFIGCAIGAVLSDKPKAQVHNSYFSNQTISAILSRSLYTTDQEIEIDHNIIEEFKTGIYVINVLDGTNKIHHNTLTANPATAGTIGILAVSAFPTMNEDNDFASNTITDAKTGIYGTNQQKTLLFDNHVFSQAASGFTGNAGIKWESSFMNWIQENETGIGTGSTGLFNFGFWNKLSPYNLFFCNYPHDQGIGMLSDGSNEPSWLIRGNYEDNAFDLMLMNGGNVGNIGQYDQTTPSNSIAWDNTFTSSGLIDILSWNTDASNYRVIHRSTSMYNPTRGSIYNPSWTMNHLQTSNHLSDTYCGTLSDPSYFVLPPTDEKKMMALGILNDTIEQPIFPQSHRWMQKFNLYRILEVDTNLRNSDATLANYFVETKDNNIGIISRAMKVYSDNAEESIKKGLVDDYTDSLLALLPENICEQTFVDFLTTFNAFSDLDRKEVDTIEDRKIDFLNYWLDSTVFTSTGQLQPFTYHQIAVLDEIAQKCPYESGPAVLMARSALVLINGDPFHYSNTCEEFEEPELRLEEQTEPQQNINPTPEARIDLYPNPTNDKLNVEFIGFDEIAAHLEVRDLQGRILLDSELAKNSIINTSSLSNGLYVVTVKNFDNFVTKAKIIICK